MKNMTGGEPLAWIRGMRVMKDSAIAPEIADLYATLETILKIIGRSWLSEEWRLEDIRLLTQETLTKRGSLDDAERAKAIIQTRLRMKANSEAPLSPQRNQGLPT
ncbi:hypothetical protein [Microvirga terrestris]|uniref:Uncharacterized protein n=1 Tax=Microvirga terrestris TaxID=2791024 RepID=A0ABS0HQG5_9HYPH|nr:hypothetical protein [Microvirga terrestris]MBF9195708.1 hypothetical protein [Microvirga terrestris]